MKKSRPYQVIILFLRKYWRIIIPVSIFLALFYFFILRDLPSPTNLSENNLSQASQIFDRNGTLLYTIYADKNQTFIPLSAIPKVVQEATIAIEDREFYNHGAIDIKGIARAAIAIVFHHRIEGGSTLTQQLVKNSLLQDTQQTLLRKIKEAILAFATELIYPKDKILEMYLNQTPYGGTAWGIDAAARTYFGKEPKDLTIAESALLAGLPEAPSVYSPFGSHPELAKERQSLVLKSMETQGYITHAQEQTALEEPLSYRKIANDIKAPHFVLYVKDLLIKKYGEKLVERGGLKVKTSLDLAIQDFAQESVASEVAKLNNAHVTNGAALITNPATGEILAMVGSRGYFDPNIDGNVNVTIAHRQPGSSIKPITYAVGLMKGYTAATPFIDQPICFPDAHGQYCPLNYDLKWHGVASMRTALGNSFNIPAVKMLKVDTIPSMIATASAMGITTFTSPDHYGLSLTLGGADVTMVDMATAFGVFANQGYRIDLHPILKISDANNHILESYTPPSSPIFGTKVLPEGISFIISDILADNGARLEEFGPNSELKVNKKIVSVKTGTTNDFRDNWTIGYTPSYVVASWVGNNDNSPMSSIVSGITGAAPIWHDIMSHLLENKPAESISRPNNVIQKAVCNLSGLIPNKESMCPTKYEYFIKGTEPNQFDVTPQKVWVDKSTQDLAKPGQTDNIELKDETFITDPTGDRYCLTCPHPSPIPTPLTH